MAERMEEQGLNTDFLWHEFWDVFSKEEESEYSDTSKSVEKEEKQ